MTSKGFGVRLVILNESENLKVDSSISGFHNWINGGKIYRDKEQGGGEERRCLIFDRLNLKHL